MPIYRKRSALSLLGKTVKGSKIGVTFLVLLPEGEVNVEAKWSTKTDKSCVTVNGADIQRCDDGLMNEAGEIKKGRISQ